MKTEKELLNDIVTASANLLIKIDKEKDMHSNIIYFANIINECTKVGEAMEKVIKYRSKS